MALEKEEPIFTFGLISDVQYANIDDGYNFAQTHKRYYRNALKLLQSAICIWNNMQPKPTFLMQLGDAIDGFNVNHDGMTKASWDATMSEFNKFDGAVHHAFGNHDYYNYSHKKIAQLLPCATMTDVSEGKSVPRLRYSFTVRDKFVFVVLDTYEISTLGYDKDSPEYQEADKILSCKNPNEEKNSSLNMKEEDQKFVRFNGAVGKEQIKWLESILKEAEEQQQKVIIFGHGPLYLPATSHVCLVWDNEEVLEVLHRHSCVPAVVTGHDHHGGYAVDEHGIHHITFYGLVEVEPDDQAYGTMSVYEDKLVLKGVGKIPSVTIQL